MTDAVGNPLLQANQQMLTYNNLLALQSLNHINPNELLMYQTAAARQQQNFSGLSGYPLTTADMSSLHTMVPKQNREISYETSSKDPVLMRARVFVGSLNTVSVKREDLIGLFSPYGKLLGVTLFKGFAFVQFSSPTEADLAVAQTNGYLWYNQILDVKLAIKNMKQSTRNTPDSTIVATNQESVAFKRASLTPSETSEDTVPDIKRRRIESINEENQVAAALESTSPMQNNFFDHGMSDTLICGKCRFVTSQYTAFRDHRKLPCQVPLKKAAKVQCNTCYSIFCSDSDLLNHLSIEHNMSLYRRCEQDSVSPANCGEVSKKELNE
uniref:RRM domain-containing protein n=1 Tax=Rhabditophanes sp. KR3021 TaxID=114890 RepID=A0AC35TSR9_9BILA